MTDSAEQTVIEVALKLTGKKEFDGNGCWEIAPPNWSCPVCKRSKLHIARANQSGILQGHLHNHHDHISDYAKHKTNLLVKEQEPDRVLTEKDWWFIREKIGSFLNRFEKTLVCQDCNNADANAKSMLEGICKYFTFSPDEMAYFIEPEAHKPHKINEERLKKVYENLGDIHEYRKKLCDVLLSRSLINDRIWSQPQNAANIEHYKAAKAIMHNPDLYDGSTILYLKHKSDANLRYLSIALEKYEKKRHKKATKSEDQKWEEKQERKERLKKTRVETQKLVDTGVYFNHGELWSKDDLEELKELYSDGVTVEELSIKFGRMEKSIRSRLRKLGYKA